MKSGNSVSETGKSLSESESKPKMTALEKAVVYADALMTAEFRGRGDREKAVRFRLSKKTGVPESYLFRLTYKAREMRDVSGEVFMRLHDEYVRMCERNESAAANYKAERLALSRARQDAVAQRSDQQGD